MKTPVRLIGLISTILCDFYTHAEIDSRFMMCGYDGPPPEGNKQQKITEWLSRANRQLSNPLENFYELIEDFMETSDNSLFISVRGEAKSIIVVKEDILKAFERCSLPYPMQSSVSQKILHPLSNVPQKQAGSVIEEGIKDMSDDKHIVDKSTSISKQSYTKMNNKVFIVHGHNEAVKEKTARLITSVGLKPIILSEQPNRGKTIVEKFERNSDVGFAVILMTADDLGTAHSSAINNQLKPRARQNVILELGYFIGLLGREKVCVLIESGIETPSDIHGIVYEAVSYTHLTLPTIYSV